MKKRGRPLMPIEQKRLVKMQTRVDGTMAERLYALARRKRTVVSAITYDFYQSILSEFEADEKRKTSMSQ